MYALQNAFQKKKNVVRKKLATFPLFMAYFWRKVLIFDSLKKKDVLRGVEVRKIPMFSNEWFFEKIFLAGISIV